MVTESVLTFSSWQQAQDAADMMMDKELVKQIELMEVVDSEGQKQVKLIIDQADYLVN